MTLLSLVVPVWESRSDLERLVNYLIPLAAGGDWELVVVDDASTTPLADVILHASAYGIPTKYRKLAHRCGPGVARNVGVQLAEGEFISFVDVDDEVLLPSLLYITRVAGELGIPILSGAYQLTKSLNHEARPSQDLPLLTIVPWQERLRQYPAIWSWVFRREILSSERLTFPSLFYAEDLLFLLRISQVHPTFVQSSIVTYRHHAPELASDRNSASSPRIAETQFVQALRALEVEGRLCSEPQRSATVHWRMRIAARFLLAPKGARLTVRLRAALGLAMCVLTDPIVSARESMIAFSRK